MQLGSCQSGGGSDTSRKIALAERVAKDGTPRIPRECPLPLTGVRVVDKIISDLAAFDIVDDPNGPGLVLTQMAPGVIVADLREKPEADFVVLGESTKH